MKNLLAALLQALTFIARPSLGFAWGHEGHEVVALIAEANMTPCSLARAKAILGGASLEDVASWADDYRRDHRETGPWHYIDIPLADTTIDMTREADPVIELQLENAGVSLAHLLNGALK